MNRSFFTPTFPLIFCFLCFWAFEEYRSYNRIDREDVKKFQMISMLLDNYHSKCDRHPTTNEGLNALSEDTKCTPNIELAKKNVFTKSEKSNVVYVSDSKAYRLIIYDSSFAREVSRP